MIIAIAPMDRWFLFVNHNDNEIKKTDSDNHKIIIVITPTERWLLFVNHNENGISKTDTDNHL